MKNKIYFTLLLLGVCLTISSCSDFLEPKSRSEYTPKDAQSLSELLLGNAYPTADVSICTDLQVLDDDVTGAPYQETMSYNINGLLGLYSWQPKRYEWLDDANEKKKVDLYYTHYSKILGCNAVYEQACKITDKDEDLLTYVKAQALTLRAFYYLQLVNIYGMPFNEDKDALGVPLKLTSGVELENLHRSSVGKVYDQIVKDLNDAIALFEVLPADMQWKANFRASLPLAQLLLSRAYLYMEDWENAALWAEKVMSNRKFQVTNLNTLDEKYYDFHSYTDVTETIWPYGNLVSDCCYWVYLCNRGAENRPFLRASDELLETMNEFEGDLRNKYYIYRDKEYTYINKDGVEEYLPVAYGKVNTSTAAGKEYQPIRQASVNTFGRSFRVSEAYLNYCEARAMQYKAGDASACADALSVLNSFRAYRFNYDDFYTVDETNAEELVQLIRRERRREFCFEDMRWFDLRRWGMPEIKHVWYPDADTRTTYTLKEKDPLYCIPLPPDALELNSYLEQNPLGDERLGEIESIN